MELGHIRADRELDDVFAVVGGVVVVLRKALAHLARGDADDRVGVGVVAGRAAEDLDADAALFEFGGIALKSLFDDVRQQGGVAPAVGKKRVNEEPCQLFANQGGISGGRRLLQLVQRFRRQRHPELPDSAQAPRATCSPGVPARPH